MQTGETIDATGKTGMLLIYRDQPATTGNCLYLDAIRQIMMHK